MQYSFIWGSKGTLIMVFRPLRSSNICIICLWLVKNISDLWLAELITPDHARREVCFDLFYLIRCLTRTTPSYITCGKHHVHKWYNKTYDFLCSYTFCCSKVSSPRARLPVLLRVVSNAALSTCAVSGSPAIWIRTRESDAQGVDYINTQYSMSSTVFPRGHPNLVTEDRWWSIGRWLNTNDTKSAIFIHTNSQCSVQWPSIAEDA